MRTRFLTTLLLLLFFFTGCEKEERQTVTTPQIDYNTFEQVILDDKTEVSLRAGGVEAIFARGNLVIDNHMEAGPDTPRTFIIFNTFGVRNVVMNHSDDNGNATIQQIYCEKYDTRFNFKDVNEIPLQFYKDYSRYVGDTTYSFIPSSVNNVLVSSSPIKAIKYILVGYAPLAKNHPFKVNSDGSPATVNYGIYERHIYNRGKWHLVSIDELAPNNKANIFNIPLLL
jgi:hypothetical protein